MTSKPPTQLNLAQVRPHARPVAVIDIGTTSIRMAVAQIAPSGGVDTLDTLSRPVNLGKDTFTRGSISRETIESCVRVLLNYRRVLDEYEIRSREQVRVVATSAVREATNKGAFLDRIYIATGFRVEAIDDAEVNRLTFLGIQPILNRDPELGATRTLVVEVGGGSTEILLIQDENVVFSRTYRLGSVRLRKTLETYRVPAADVRQIIEHDIRRIVDQMRRDVPGDESIQILALGGEIRFAASRLLPDWKEGAIGKLSVASLERLTQETLESTVEEVVRDYNLTFPEAETLGPTLLACVLLTRAYRKRHVLIARTTLRSGLLMEMAVGGAWTESFRRQILRSAIEIGRKFEFNEEHARRVAALAGILFRELQEDHGLEPKYALLLEVAALLHNVGHFINSKSHHKHSMYLIRNVDLFGLGEEDLLRVALVARYHRRATPRTTHEFYGTLDADGRVTVAKLSAILRVADALARSESSRTPEIVCRRENGRFEISLPSVEDLSLEELALKQKGSMFQDVYGMQVVLRRTR